MNSLRLESLPPDVVVVVRLLADLLARSRVPEPLAVTLPPAEHVPQKLLLRMEEVAKQDGSLEIGGISPEAAAMLELTRMNQLFQKFPAVHAEDSQAVLVPEPAAETEPAPSGQAAQPQPVAA